MASNDLRLQVILQAIDKATAPLRRIKGASGDTARALKESRDKLKELDRAQSEMRGFRVAAVELKRNERSLRDLKTKAADYRAELERHRQTHGAVMAKVKVAVSEHGKLARALLAGKTSGEQFNQAFNASRIRLEAAQRAAGRSSSSLKFLSDRARNAETSIAALSARQAAAQQRLSGYKERLDAAGIGTDNLNRKTRNLRTSQEQLKSALEAQRAQLSALHASEKRLADLRQRHGKAMLHTGMAAGAGYGAYAAGSRGVQAVLGPVQSFAAHEDAMLGIARQVPGARDELGQLTPVYRAIEEQVRALSHEFPIATTQIAEMVTAAARMEVPTDELQSFTRTAAMMATAFDAVPGEITEAMGKVAKNFKIQLTEIEGLADSINFLDDNAISKGADIIGFLNRTSGVISTVAMSPRDAAALGSTLLTLGEREETAGTAANAMVQKFAAATKGTKKFQSAMAEIGLKSADVQTGMSKDATATLLEVIGAIRALPREKQIGVMVELVGVEHSDTLAKLVDKPEELQRQLELARGPQAQGSMRREASARNDTISARWQMTKNRLFNANTELGKSLKPALIELLNLVNPLLERFTQWVAVNPGLVGGVLKVAAAISALIALAGALLVPLALVAGKILLMRFLFAQVTSVMGPLAAVVGGPLIVALKAAGNALLVVGRAMLLSPFGLVLAAVMALALAGLLIVKYWEPIKAFLGGMWAGFLAGISPLLPALEGLFGALAEIFAPLKPVWDWFTGKLQEARDLISQLLAPFQATQDQLNGAASAGQVFGKMLGSLVSLAAALPIRFWTLGADIIGGLVGGIMSMWGGLRNVVNSVADATIGWFKEKLGIKSPSRVFMLAGNEISNGAAEGISERQSRVRQAALGMAAAAAVALPMAAGAAGAGTEAGALQFDRRPPLGATATQRPLSIGGDTIHITIQAAPGMDAQALARAVSAELDRRQRSKRATMLSSLSDID